MEQRPVGRSGLRVSALTLSTATWGVTAAVKTGAGVSTASSPGGNTAVSAGAAAPGSGAAARAARASTAPSGTTRGTDPESAAALLSTFRTAGGTLVDVGAGTEAEAMLARLIAGEADEVLIASRAARTEHGGSRQNLLTQLDRTLRTLARGHIDLWQLPLSGLTVPFEETLGAADHAVASGRVRYVGLRDHGAWRMARAATWQAARSGRAPIVSNQVEYSLLARGIESEVAPAAAELGVGLLAYAALAGGALLGRNHPGRGAGAALAGDGDPRALGIVDAVTTAADGLATTPVAVALSWMLGRPGVASVVVGTRTTAQLTAAISAQPLLLPSAIRSALDDVSAPVDGYAEIPASGAAEVLR